MQLRIAALLFLCLSAWAQNHDPIITQAKQDAKTLSAQGASAIAGNGQKIPHFSSESAQTQYFQKGQGATLAPGVARQNECAAFSSEQLAGYAGKSCDATNFLARQPHTRPDIRVARTEQLVADSHERTLRWREDDLVSQSNAPVCHSRVIPGQSQYHDEVCFEDGTLQEQVCNIATQVDVDEHFRYECTSTPKKITQSTCEKIYNHSCQAAPFTETCPGGSTPANGICSSTEQQTQSANVSYNCPAGYSRTGTSCSKQISKPALTFYACPVSLSCPDAGCANVVVGSNCISTITTSASASTSYVCPPGFKNRIFRIRGRNQWWCVRGYPICTVNDPNCFPARLSTSYNCPAGTTLIGTSCRKTITQAANVSYSCPSGYTLSGSSCIGTQRQAATPVYSCNAGGVLSGTSCTYAVTVSSEADKNFHCNAAQGTLTPGVVQAGLQSYVCCKETVTNQCLALERRS